MILKHLRANVVAYLALLIAMTSTSYAAASLANSSVTTRKLHHNAVISSKIRNRTIKAKDLRTPTWVQSTTLTPDSPPAIPDVVSVAPYDFVLPDTGRASVTVNVSSIAGGCDSGSSAQPTAGLYVDNVAIPATAVTVPGAANARPLQLTATVSLASGFHSGRLGITCPGSSLPNLDVAGTKTWQVILTDR